jgi:tRNA U34 5-methylaminomethyl-2-thiouridine-forming methyltransferase MnmC
LLKPHHLLATTTADGSTTLRHLKLDVLYRSDNGARGESEHVFVQGADLEHINGDWRVLELGFGTGLNFLVTAAYAIEHQRALHYIAVDAAPIPPEFIPDGYPTTLLARDALQRCREDSAPVTLQLGSVQLSLYPQRWQQTKLTIDPVDAIFHDPFDPSVNPDCWTKEAFAWSREFLKPHGRLVTYSAAGHIRRAMRDAGYVVARAEGYGKKREMTIASPKEEALSPNPIKYRP